MTLFGLVNVVEEDSMSATLRDLKDAAATLSTEEQFELEEHLQLLTLEVRDEIRSEWNQQIKRRFAEIVAGTAEAVPLEDLFAKCKVA
jgi:hypothetical protein